MLRTFQPNQYVLLRNEEEHSHGVPARHVARRRISEAAPRPHHHPRRPLVYRRESRPALPARCALRSRDHARHRLWQGRHRQDPAQRRRRARAGAERRVREDAHHPRDHAHRPRHRFPARPHGGKDAAVGAAGLRRARTAPRRARASRSSSRRRSRARAKHRSRQKPSRSRFHSPAAKSPGRMKPLMQAGLLEIEAIAHIRGRSHPARHLHRR